MPLNKETEPNLIICIRHFFSFFCIAQKLGMRIIQEKYITHLYMMG